MGRRTYTKGNCFRYAQELEFKKINRFRINMEIHEQITENPEESFLVIRKRKPRVEIEDSNKELKISTEQDFDFVQKTAHAYAKDYEARQNNLDSFKKVGKQIGIDFQFRDKGAGANTIAGQIEKNTIENRDCKLPTFLLAVAWKEISGVDNTEIFFLNSQLSHPYVETECEGQKVFGHYTKPRIDDVNPTSQFELLGQKETADLLRFKSLGRTTSFDISPSGMAGIDEMFSRI
jgi:hypothetical protein